MGTFTYAQDAFVGWIQVNADEEQLVVLARGFDFKSRQLEDLYKIQIKRSIKSNIWMWIVAGVFIFLVLFTLCIICTLRIYGDRKNIKRKYGENDRFASEVHMTCDTN